MFNFTRTFLAFRRAQPALQTGEVEIMPAPEGVLAFERRRGADRLLCVFELAGQATRFDVPEGARLLPSLLSGALERGELRLPAFGGGMLALPASG